MNTDMGMDMDTDSLLATFRDCRGHTALTAASSALDTWRPSGDHSLFSSVSTSILIPFFNFMKSPHDKADLACLLVPLSTRGGGKKGEVEGDVKAGGMEGEVEGEVEEGEVWEAGFF